MHINGKMKFLNHLGLGFILLFVLNASCQNKRPNYFDENDYKEVSRGQYKGQFTITLQNQLDTNFFIRKFYPDSLYNDSSFIVIKRYFYKDVMDGPVKVYSRGRLTSEGFMRDNKRHGEFIYYSENGKIDRRGSYADNKPKGIWEDYYSTGILFKKIYYNENGKFIKQEIHDTKEGKLLRTEYQESREY